MSVACDACRLKKRRCDKALPKCSQCSIRSCECIYPQRRRRKRPQGISSQQNEFENLPTESSLSNTLPEISDRSRVVTDADGPWMKPLEFPAALFLDRHVFRQLHVHVPLAGPIAPEFPAAYLGTTQVEQDSFVSEFFDGVHKWLPVISKERFRARLEKLRDELPADVALLLLCMRLIAQAPPTLQENARTEMYFAAKQGFANLEIAGVLSIECLEAGLLILLYEIGHAIYPSAFLSVGACLRYGHALGFEGAGTSRLRRPFNRVEVEEHKRLWWAIILLDRFITLGCPDQPLSANDPEDDGSMTIHNDSQKTALANTFSPDDLGRRDHGCPALIAQATRLLGQVLRHVAKYRYLKSRALKIRETSVQEVEEAAQLDRTLTSLIHAAEVEAQMWGVAIEHQLVICHSALLALHQPDESQGQGAAYWDENGQQAVRLASDKVMAMCRDILSSPEMTFESVSPFFIRCVYVLATTCIPGESDEAAAAKQTYRKVLQRLNSRWKAAGVYLEILEAREVL